MEWITAFLEYLRFERNYSALTIRAYGDDLKAFACYLEAEECGPIDFLHIESAWVRAWMVSLMETGQTAATVNRKLSSLRSFFRFLKKKGAVTTDPLAKVVPPKKKRPLPSFLKEKEMDSLLDEVDYGEGFWALRDKLIIEMFYFTGMRLAELVGLDESDVDLSRSLIRVVGKRNKERLIPFGEELATSVEQYRVAKVEMFPSQPHPFFLGQTGQRIGRSVVYRLVKKHLSKVSTLKKRSPHVLRHTFATSMLNNEAGLGAVKELLGHESMVATEVYVHTTFEELKKTYKQAHPRA